jgi:hypothetical protein
MQDDNEPERRFLVIVRGDKPSQTTTTAKSVMDTLSRMSRGKAQLAFSSADASVVGVFAKMAKPTPVIRAALEEASTYKDRGFVLVLELGADFAAIGNSSGWQWLQH